MEDVFVKKSKIHGKGVFANRDFKKGEIVIKYSLKVLTEEEFHNLSKSEKQFTSFHDGKYFLFPSPERYVNHSCEPNVHPNLKDKYDVCIKDIKKGEEILADYTKEGVPELNLKCNCGSKNCKKIIKND
jgi:SET domain-containing protein